MTLNTESPCLGDQGEDRLHNAGQKLEFCLIRWLGIHEAQDGRSDTQNSH